MLESGNPWWATTSVSRLMYGQSVTIKSSSNCYSTSVQHSFDEFADWLDSLGELSEMLSFVYGTLEGFKETYFEYLLFVFAFSHFLRIMNESLMRNVESLPNFI